MKVSKSRHSTIGDRTVRPGEVLVRAGSVVRIQLRRGQHLPLDRLGSGELLRIERGCLILKSAMAQGGSRVVSVLFPDDIISREAAPPLPAIGLIATVPATVLRFSRKPPEGAGQADGQVAHAFAKLAARTALHAVALSELTAEQRIATFLVEMALRLGSPTPAGCAFELPLSRTDIAYYLALNPDTMSRLMSRLRARGLLSSPARGWATIPDLEALAALTPLAATLQGLCPGGECGAGLGSLQAPGP